MEMMHIWSAFRFMVANPGRLWKMAAIVTKNRFFFFLNSLNIVKSQCCYQTIKEQCIYNNILKKLETIPSLLHVLTLKRFTDHVTDGLHYCHENVLRNLFIIFIIWWIYFQYRVYKILTFTLWIFFLYIINKWNLWDFSYKLI
jgi:hypothetical protein